MEIKQVEWHKEIPADLKRRLAEVGLRIYQKARMYIAHTETA